MSRLRRHTDGGARERDPTFQNAGQKGCGDDRERSRKRSRSDRISEAVRMADALRGNTAGSDSRAARWPLYGQLTSGAGQVWLALLLDGFCIGLFKPRYSLLVAGQSRSEVGRQRSTLKAFAN